jgi:CBS domain containing-hemolysin-like protein
VEQVSRIRLALDDLQDTTVREVMTPRVEVVALPIPVRAADVARAARESGHSQFPVYDDDLDRIIGVLFIHDLFRAGWEGDPDTAGGVSPLDISRRLRQPYLVPESRLVLDVLAEMRRDHRGFAVAVDEYGGVAGVLTIKDLLEALVGDLHNEFDPAEEPDVIRVDRTRWLVDGGASLDEVREHPGIDIPDGEYVTFGGFLLDVLGRIPEEGEELRFDGWELRIAEMDKRRIAKAVARRLESPSASGEAHTPRADRPKEPAEPTDPRAGTVPEDAASPGT